MLDVSLENASFQFAKSGFHLRDISLLFRKTTFTVIAGPGGSGKSTLLNLLAGDLRLAAGVVRIGARDTTSMPAKRRPLLRESQTSKAPGRWSVQHLLIAALSQRSLDREDRMREFQRLVERWDLSPVLDRRLDSLSSQEVLVARMASIEARRPAVLLLERLFESASAPQRCLVAERFFRTLRDLGTTVVAEISTIEELSFFDRLAMLENGRITQEGTPLEIYRRPATIAAARATGSVNVLPAVVRGNIVETRAGSWEVENAVDGDAFVLLRPGDLRVAQTGEESDFIFGVEEVRLTTSGISVLGYLPGGQVMEIVLPHSVTPRKGQLLPVRVDSSKIVILPREGGEVSTDWWSLPSRSESR